MTHVHKRLNSTLKKIADYMRPHMGILAIYESRLIFFKESIIRLRQYM